MKKKIMIFAIVFLPFQVFAETKYQCGDHCTATLDDDGVMRVSGTGEMWGYSGTTRDETPWYNDRGKIKAVVVEEGITRVGTFAFFYCDGIKSVELAQSVRTVGDSAFDEVYHVENVVMYDSTVWENQQDFNRYTYCPQIKINCYGDIDKCETNFLNTPLLKSPTVFAYKGKKIYTIDEAERVSRKEGNVLKLRYK